MAETQVLTTVLVLEHCCNCGVPFGLERSFRNNRKDDHKNFYCPNGHPQHFVCKSEAEKLRDEVKSKQQDLDYAYQRIDRLHEKVTKQNYSIRALKSAKTKILNKVKNGVCPCCQRTFKDLQEHFKSKHPDLLEAVKIDPIHSKINGNDRRSKGIEN